MTRKIIPFSKLEEVLKQAVLKLLSENPQTIEVNFKDQKSRAVFLTKGDIQYLIPLDVPYKEFFDFDDDDDDDDSIDDMDDADSLDDLEISED